jgi:hypothetical protein
VYDVGGDVKGFFMQLHPTPLALRAGSGVKGAREAGVHRQTLDAADGSPPFRADEAELRPIQDSVSALDQGSLL